MADLQIDPECHTCGAMPGDRHSDACRRGHLIPLGQLEDARADLATTQRELVEAWAEIDWTQDRLNECLANYKREVQNAMDCAAAIAPLEAENARLQFELERTTVVRDSNATVAREARADLATALRERDERQDAYSSALVKLGATLRRVKDLERENARLRAALERLVRYVATEHTPDPYKSQPCGYCDAIAEAQAALCEGGPDAT